MMTVLRGQSIKHFREHLLTQGTRHQYVYENAPATRSWFEVLRQRDGPDFDNEPLTWIKDMIERDPLNRPTAVALAKQVLESTSYTQFCCFSCACPTETWNEPFSAPNAQYESDYPDYRSAIEYNESWDQNTLEVKQASDTPFQESRSYAVESWLGVEPLQEFEGPMIDPSMTEFSAAPYDVESDDSTEVPVSRTAALPSQMPRRLLSFNFLETGIYQPPTEMQGKYDGLAEGELPYDVISDESESEDSECTVRPLDLIDDLLSEDGLDSDPQVSSLSTSSATNSLDSPSTQSTLVDGYTLNDDICGKPSHSTIESEKRINFKAIEATSNESLDSPKRATSAFALVSGESLVYEENGKEMPDLPELKPSNAPQTGLDINPVIPSAPKSILKPAKLSVEVNYITKQDSLAISGKSENVKQRPTFVNYRPEVTAPLTLENLKKLPGAEKTTTLAPNEEGDAIGKSPSSIPEQKAKPGTRRRRDES